MPKANLKSKSPYHVAVIGAGASGTLVAAQFQRLAPSYGRLALIGNQDRPARGVAYETPYKANLLNVAAGNMSAFPDDMSHFVRWLEKHLPNSNAATFAPRRLYGDYLADIFNKTLDTSEQVDYFSATATGLTREEDSWKIHLDNGSSIEAHSVILALGNLLLPNDPIDFSGVGSNYCRNPWSPAITKNLASDASVLLIGTGLTMVDVALSLREAGHRGAIHAISRHGRLYQMHQPYQPRPLKEIPESFRSPHKAVHWMLAEIKRAEQEGNNWRAVIDSLRPHTSAIWSRWTQTQRASFLRHARNLWDIHRHRMSPEVADQLSVLIEDRTLAIHCGQLVSVKSNQHDITVVWKSTETGEAKTLNVARIVNCTGPSRDITLVQSSLVANLLADGWIKPDALQLGLETDSCGRLVGKNGNVAPDLYTLGPLRIAGLWESIAIPEIRNQAADLAKLLVAESIYPTNERVTRLLQTI
jgi:uncharacterized NAD(P)/FAD-binding protein YdhS